MENNIVVDGIKIERGENGRHKNDLYPTLSGVTVALLSRVVVDGLVCSPCAGHGHMTRVLTAAKKRVITNDIDTTIPGLDYYGDAADPMAEVWKDGLLDLPYARKYDWVVENPPFSLALPIIKNAWDSATVGIAFLLRLSFLEPTTEIPNAMRGSAWAENIAKRGEWLDSHAQLMSNLIIMGSPRPSFTGTGTDSVTPAWMVWRKGWKWGTSVQYAMNWKVK